MKILYTDFTLKYYSLDIYTAGCKTPHCNGCHNPETWGFNQGEIYNKLYFNRISKYFDDFDNLIHNIMIFGGEPLDNNISEVENFIKDLLIFKRKIWLFTKFELKEIPDNIKSLCDFIKTGKYIVELSVKNNQQFGINLSTSNQHIYKIK